MENIIYAQDLNILQLIVLNPAKYSHLAERLKGISRSIAGYLIKPSKKYSVTARKIAEELIDWAGLPK